MSETLAELQHDPNCSLQEKTQPDVGYSATDVHFEGVVESNL